MFNNLLLVGSSLRYTFTFCWLIDVRGLFLTQIIYILFLAILYCPSSWLLSWSLLLVHFCGCICLIWKTNLLLLFLIISLVLFRVLNIYLCGGADIILFLQYCDMLILIDSWLFLDDSWFLCDDSFDWCVLDLNLCSSLLLFDCFVVHFYFRCILLCFLLFSLNRYNLLSLNLGLCLGASISCSRLLCLSLFVFSHFLFLFLSMNFNL